MLDGCETIQEEIITVGDSSFHNYGRLQLSPLKTSHTRA